MKTAGLFLLALWALNALARNDIYEFDNLDQEKRFSTLSSELRCLVCQNQTIRDSDADLAKDLRRQIYEMIKKNQSNDEILEFMVTRYGDFVLYRPPIKTTTIILWAGPFVLLVIALLVVYRFIRKSSLVPEMSDRQREHIRQLLDENNKDT